MLRLPHAEQTGPFGIWAGFERAVQPNRIPAAGNAATIGPQSAGAATLATSTYAALQSNRTERSGFGRSGKLSSSHGGTEGPVAKGRPSLGVIEGPSPQVNGMGPAWGLTPALHSERHHHWLRDKAKAVAV